MQTHAAVFRGFMHISHSPFWVGSSLFCTRAEPGSLARVSWLIDYRETQDGGDFPFQIIFSACLNLMCMLIYVFATGVHKF